MRREPQSLDFENIFLDASNLGDFDTEQLEGRVEKPVAPKALIAVGLLFILAVCAFVYQTFTLQITKGEHLAAVAQENRLAHSLVFAQRGVLYDRTGTELAWNEEGDAYARRVYSTLSGLGHVLGYVRYPKADAHGLWWRTEYTGVSGAELLFNDTLGGINGKQIVEVDALGEIKQWHLVEQPQGGSSVVLSIDAAVQNKLYEVLSRHAYTQGFVGGGSVIMDVQTGEILALTSFPEFSSQVMTDGVEDVIAQYTTDSRKPFLDRVVSGVYTPGSIVKPFFAVAALTEAIISPEKSIFSPGYISIPNPYNPDQPTIMKDWKAHGWTDMRKALEVSADVYFYSIGGGYQDQKGLGITKLDTYAKRFGLGEVTGIPLPGEAEGLIPTPEWKASVFEGDEWRLGDTYNTSIGQYGFQVTPIQMVRATAALANNGYLLTPQLLASSTPQQSDIKLSTAHLAIVREGMEQAVHGSDGTARALAVPGITLAGKTGTAEVGSRKQYMNSWVIGFWPAENPRYAFATVLERAPAGTLSGAAPGMRAFFEWLVVEHPEYVR